ncbi:MAG: hypothetical protein HY736_24790 [Verrucomicrobia bacterium]|nr:hypothetical protein [Verrucomicrobiota bacterium]
MPRPPPSHPHRAGQPAAQPPGSTTPSSRTAGLVAGWWPGLVVFVATLLAYLPAVNASFIWNDSDYVTAPALRSLDGLWRIWFEVGATEQYYPFLHSAFWMQHRLWGDAPAGYYLVNIVLHAGAARPTTIAGYHYQYFTNPPIKRLKSYDNFFPMISAKYYLSRSLEFQTGSNQAISRPPVDSLTGAWLINEDAQLRGCAAQRPPAPSRDVQRRLQLQTLPGSCGHRLAG